MTELKLTASQIKALQRNLCIDKEMAKKVEVYNYTDLMCKVLAMVKLCRVVAENAANGFTKEDVFWELANLLEVAENLAEMYEEMEVLDTLRKELV